MASIELHVWPAGLSLPSFDAECLSAIAYLNETLPPKVWALVPSNNPTRSPTNALPALKDGIKWVGGFSAIVTYIEQKSQGKVHLNAVLTPKIGAEDIAFSAFVPHHAIPLLALSRYLTPENYTQVVRPLYSKFLPWPVQYHIPMQHHNRAIEQTNHLPWAASGLSYGEMMETPPATANLAGINFPLSSKQPGIKEIITLRVRLEGLVKSFLVPIQQKLGTGNKYFFGGDKASTVDCLLVGYLSACLYPEMPSPWLAETMRRDFPRVCEYVDELKREALARDDLPWQEVEPQDVLTVGRWLVASSKNIVPPALKKGGTSDGSISHIVPTVFAAAVAVAAAMVYVVFGNEMNVVVKQDELNEGDVIVGGAIDISTQPAGSREIYAQGSNDIVDGFSAHNLLGLR